MDNNIFKILVGVTVIGGIGGGILLIIRTLTDYTLKKMMINKGFVNEDTQAIFKQRLNENEYKYSSLKWGLILFFAGLSLVVMEYLGVTAESPLPYGLFTVSVSLGFLIYFFLVRNGLNKHKE